MAFNQEGVSDDEDVVEYRLFPNLNEFKLPEEQQTVFLEEKGDAYLAYLSRYCADYIWHKDPFSLLAVTSSASDKRTGDTPAHLYGRTCFGENIEDEWFIVFLLIELSKEFPDLVIRVYDNDGEFLLIEAANHLPKWLNPEASADRVFLYQGDVHVIPKSTSKVNVSPVGVPFTAEWVNYIRNNKDRTIASSGIQQDIQNRIADYPAKKATNLHHAHCYIPASLSAVLDYSPSLLAPIVQAFCHRDVLDLKNCVTFRHFRPGTRVMRQVKFTRFLYAQLIQERFQPDRRSGYTLPAQTNAKFKAYDLGMKLAHGAEILCSKYNEEDVMADDTECLKSDARWQHFVESLRERGYFKGEIEGSKLYCRLLDEAKAFYLSTAKPDRSKTGVGLAILSSIKSIEFDLEKMRQQEKDLPPEDDDSWIEISHEQLDNMLSKKLGKFGKDSTFGEETYDLSKVAESMKSFVDKVSSYEGAEVPKGEGDDDDVQFDPNSFMQSMQKIFEFEDPESDSSSEMDEYESDDELGDSFALKSKPKTGNRPAAKAHGKVVPKKNSKAPLKGKTMKEYHEMMDRELAVTTIGKSFTREGDEYDELSSDRPKPMPRKKKELKKQQQAAASGSGQKMSTTKTTTKTQSTACSDNIDDEDDDFRPVSVDVNLVKNLLKSYDFQQGPVGPTSAVLGSMGVRLPPHKPVDDDV